MVRRLLPMRRTTLSLFLRLYFFILCWISICGTSVPFFPTEATTENVTAAFTVITETDPFNETDYSTVSTPIIEPEICAANLSIGIDVINRTSSMFDGWITYNCSSIEISALSIFVNELEVDFCSITNGSVNETINILCENIEKHAGRNWTFTIGSTNVSNQLIVNETFHVTLTPLSLPNATNISLTVHPDLTSAFVSIPNCGSIAASSYLLFQCSNTSDFVYLDACQANCSNLIPGSIYEASLLRLPIPIVDRANETFPDEIVGTIYRIDLDTVTNLTYAIDNDTVTISFSAVRGNFDDINITCTAQDLRCSDAPTIVSSNVGNCSTCTSLSLDPIERGVRYQCQAATIKEDFDDALSEQLSFSTPLEPVYSNQSPVELSFNSSEFTVNVITSSDFETIQSLCIPNEGFTSPCAIIRRDHESCSTTLLHRGNQGCNYQCSYRAKKSGTASSSSKNYTIELFPPDPVIRSCKITSRSINISWTTNNGSIFVQVYEVYLNRTFLTTVWPNVTTHTQNNLLPNRDYKFRVTLIANRNVSSIPVMLTTLEEAPERPHRGDIDKKIEWDFEHPLSTDKQLVMRLDPSLFSDNFGTIRNYSIYIRQDQNKGQAPPDTHGTYAAAWTDASVDYLAMFLSRSALHVQGRSQLIIGNETTCVNNVSSTIPCNGRLRSNRNYSLIIDACNKAGCTIIHSRVFQTRSKQVDSPSERLPMWAIVLLVTVSLLLLVFLVRQRKRLACSLNDDQSDFQVEPSSLPLASFNSFRPKVLRGYLDMTHGNESTLTEEYHELERRHPPCQRPDEDADWQELDRYRNIFARGPWKRTAVYLTGQHRSYDYINANFIRGCNHPKQYIACQGPMQSTCGDFWDMISQYHVSTIIMLTQLEQSCQRNRPKCRTECAWYYPCRAGQKINFNRLSVQTISVEEDPDMPLEIRVLALQEPTGERRLVHYHYKGWQDYCAVKSEQLFNLIAKINTHGCVYRRGQSSAPVVVHCNAGVGRTGTYIAAETLILQLENSSEDLSTMQLDVMGLVYQLRQDRMKMVQTRDQYILVNRCVEEYLRRMRKIHRGPFALMH